MAENLDEKRIFLICSSDSERIKAISYKVSQTIRDVTIYESHEGMDALFKMDNVPPHVLILDSNLPKMSGIDVTARMLKNKGKKFASTAAILLGKLPEKEYFVDNVVSGQVQFVESEEDHNSFVAAIAKAMNFVSFGEAKGYRIVFLNKDDTLFKEGDQGDCVYLIKSGELQAQRGDGSVLGLAKPGEFVGEMSHFNHEPRSATIKAIGECELIQIPFGTLDAVLFTKPAWSKALIQTLSKRLKNTLNLKNA